MKAIITVDVPEHQIGQEVSVYFKDTMCVNGTCESETEVYAKHDTEIIKETVESIWGKPCADAVSRQAVNELSKELVHTTRDKADFLCNFWERLQKLPPINPQKSGKWIEYDDERERYDEIECSECGRNFTVDAYRWCDIGFTKDDLNFCPNCGAKMESEDKE